MTVVTLVPDLMAGDGRRFAREGDPEVRVSTYKLIGLPHDETGFIWTEHDALWRFLLGAGEWSGEYASKEDALAALQTEVGVALDFRDDRGRQRS